MSDAYRVCAVVPTFDNPRTVRAAVEAVRDHLADVIVVDDGSGPEGKEACADLEADGLALLLRRDANGGKGAAVKAGFREASSRGFSHVFQVDADGQHDLGCMKEFLRIGAEQPDALLLGYPLYDSSVPRGRLLARRFTSFWVALELGGRGKVRDAMVGFRLYPLAAALAAGARGERMDFDVEIAVRMARAGVPVVNLPVGVHYPTSADGGVSHFQPLRDNLRFCLLHSRLCIAGLFGWARRGLRGGGS